MSGIKKDPPAQIVCALLFVVTLLLYWPVHSFDFINYDDPTYITKNRPILSGLSWPGLEWAFTTGAAANWHPLTWLSHMTDVQFFGLAPGRHHLVNAFLHALNAVLLFLVCRRTTKACWPGFFVAALFAWHPLRVESVAWISERKDVLSGLFFLMTLFAYVLYAEPKQRHADSTPADFAKRASGMSSSTVFYVGALILFALGLMSKPMLVTVPFVLLLLDFWPLKRAAPLGGGPPDPGGAPAEPWLRLAREKIPFFALSFASCVATYLAQSHGGSVASLTKLSVGMRLANAIVAYGFYVRTAVWPEGLAVFYPHPQVWPVSLVLISALVLSAISGLAIWQTGKRPYVLMGWLWFLGMLVPVIGLVQVGDQAYADRYTYLPMIGIIIAVVWIVRGIAERSSLLRFGAAAFGGIVLIANLCGARQQLEYWRNAETLFRHALAVTKGNYVAYNCLGDLRMDQKQLSEAKEEYLAALAIYPLYLDAQINAGRVLTQLGKTDEAITHLEKAVQIQPRAMLAYYHLGIALGEQGNYQEASDAYRKAVSLEPAFANAHYNLGLSLAKLGRLAEAESEYREAVRLDPDMAYAHYSLALVLRQSDRAEEAVEHFQRTVELNPAYLPARQELGRALLELGRLEESVPVYEEILRIQTNSVVAQNNLGLALARLGKLPDAIPHFAEVVRLDSANFSARYNLASAFLFQGNYAAAATNFSEALRLKPGDTNVLSKLAICESHAVASGKEKSP